LTRQQQEQKHRDGNDHEGQTARTDAVTDDVTEEQQRNDTRVPLDLTSHNACKAARTSGEHDQHVGGGFTHADCPISCVYASAERADLCADERSPERAQEMNVLGFRSEQLRVNGLSQAATLSEIEANCRLCRRCRDVDRLSTACNRNIDGSVPESLRRTPSAVGTRDVQERQPSKWWLK
jgi:hypothetical protein